MIFNTRRWHFAYTCILEEHVRRAQRNWDWNHMKCHRDTCRSYAKIYHSKLTTKQPSADIDNKLAEHEKKLDIFNLVIIRQQIEMEVRFSEIININRDELLIITVTLYFR